MTLVPDEHVFAPMTVAETSPIIHAHLPGAEVTSDCFDAFVAARHDAEEAILPATAYAIARDLRGGADPDPSQPTDWHVRSVQSMLLTSDRGDHPRERERIGTTIWLSRTYAVPSGYDEERADQETIAAPGVAPVRA